ncbi:MAG: polyphosphate kinase 1 [Bdellovibrionales bacterium]|nr:polyphosphate kinase 1 [Bdellovibrionales bacterium]
MNTHSAEQLFYNRELSWLDFNSRVLHLAADSSVPLLERINFLIIFASNLDEFFMKRVGSLSRHVASGVNLKGHDGIGAEEQLRLIRGKVIAQRKQADRLFTEELQPSLAEAGVRFLTWRELSDLQKRHCEKIFETSFFPLLTPLAVDAAHPFPLLSNLSTSLGVILVPPSCDERLFARVKTSAVQPQWIRLPSNSSQSNYHFISSAEVISQHLGHLFPNMSVAASTLFRITRNADLEVDEEDADDLRELIEEELRQQRFARVVRLEHPSQADAEILGVIKSELNLNEDDLYEIAGQIDYSALGVLRAIPLPQHRYEPWTPINPVELNDNSSIFSLIKQRDLLVHHPYESFATTVERFVREAAEDPDVLSIKMTVYRVGDETPLIPYLVQAAKRGKQVVCMVELKARFEEERNIFWAEKLEEAGVHVIYGISGLKIHAKTLLVVRRESEGVRCYAHIGTGNYHWETAKLYTDYGLFTAKAHFTQEILHLFNYLTGRSLKDDYRHLLVAPINMQQKFTELIDREIEHKKVNQPSYILCKMNSLEDRHMIAALYRAAQAGVPVDLVVRGICCLRVGVPGISDSIRVISVMGRLLEHSRVFYFQNGQADPLDGDFYIGSADWMGRNLHRRVELVVPLEERIHRERIWQAFQVMLNDSVHAWQMSNDGTYQIREVANSGNQDGTHETMMELARER